MQELEILNLKLEHLDDDPISPGEGRVWFNSTDDVPKTRSNGHNRLLISPDDDFEFRVPLKNTLYINDTILIYDVEDDEYRRIKASVILDQMSTVKDVFKTMHAEAGITNVVADGDDQIYFVTDGNILQTVGNTTGVKSIKFDWKDQFNSMVLAGPVNETQGKPTFRHLTDGDMPGSYNPSKWDEAVSFTTIITGNPTNVTMADLGYDVVTVLADPGQDDHLATEKAIRTEINTKELGLGNPGTNGWILSSTTAGVRSWIVPPVGLTPVSDILYWDSINSKYIPYAIRTIGTFDNSSTDPIHSTRLNYDGDFYVTNLTISTLLTMASGALTFEPKISNGSGAVSYILDTTNILSTTGAKLLSLRNQTVEKFYIDKDGEVYANGVHLGGSIIPVSDILYWDSGNSKYIPYVTQTSGKLDSSGTTPVHTTRLNYDGYFWSTKVYSGGVQVVSSLTSGLLKGTILTGDLGLDPWTVPQNGNLYTGTTNPSNTARLNYDGYFYATYVASSSGYSQTNLQLNTSGVTIDANSNNNTTLRLSQGTGSNGHFIQGCIGTTANIYFDFNPLVTNGSGAISYIFDTYNALSTAGAKIVSFKNNGSEKFYIDKDGEAYANGVHLVGASGSIYTNAVATPTTIGGIVAGSTFSSQTMQQMWDALLYPYQVPTFTAFSVSGQATPIECGIAMDTASKAFIWSTSNPTNIQANTIAIYDVTALNSLATGLSNTGSTVISCSTITNYNSGDTQVYRISGTNSNSVAMANLTVTYTWLAPFYYGVGAAALSVSDLQALTKSVVAKSGKIVSYSPSSQKIYFAYDASYGYLTKIQDPNGFDITSTFTVSTISFTNNSPNYKGTTKNYYVYESNTLQTQTAFAITFIF
jgi:hypothetical protein